MKKFILSLLISITFISINSPQTSADVCVGGGGWMYRLKKTSSKFYNMIDGTHYINRTSKDMLYKSEITRTVTISAKSNCTLSGGWGPVNATIGYNANTSETWTTTDSVTITICPGEEGWNKYGVKRDIWEGEYLYITKYGKEINQKPIVITSPRHKVVEAITKRVR